MPSSGGAGPSTSAPRSPTAPCGPTSWASGGPATSRPRPRTSRPCGPSCSRRSRPGRSGSPPRAPSGTGPSTASRCRAPTPPRTSCSASGRALGEAGHRRLRAGPGRARPARLLRRRRGRRSTGCAGSRPPSTGPVTFALLQVDDDPELWRELLAASLEAVRRGRPAVPAGRRARRPGSCRATTPRSACSPTSRPTRSCKAQGLSPDGAGRGPGRSRGAPVASCRGRRVAGAGRGDGARPTGAPSSSGDPPDYEPGPERSLAGLAAAAGLHAARGGLRRDGSSDDGQGLLYVPILNYATGDLDHVREMLLHPRGAARAGRRRRPHRHHLRRVHADLHAHALDARPHAGARRCRSSTW